MVANQQTRVCAIMVTYHPQSSVIENVARLRPQVDEIVVVDNGSGANFAALLLELEKMPGIRLVRNPANLGIASALNSGIQYAQRSGYEWVATFDQDSAVTPNFMTNMLAAHDACPFKDKVALISPVHCGSEAEWKQMGSGESSPIHSPIRVAMTSGSLIKTRAFLDAGLYDEGMFIDYVDFDFCLRLQQHGCRMIRSGRSCLLHQLGSLEAHKFIGFPLTIKSHNAIRYYYIMRNRVIMYRRYAAAFPAWVVNDFAWLLLDAAKILLFERAKRAKLRHALKGIGDGLAGKSGPLAKTES